MRKLFCLIVLFTIFACFMFVNYNPTIATDLTSDYAAGEVFTGNDDRFDFGNFALNSTGTHNFTAKIIAQGHTQFVDNTGNITINYLELDKMIRSSRDWNDFLLGKQLEKRSWSIDGVVVHEIDFIFHGELYSAYLKNSTKNAVIYLSTPDEKDTADMMNSITFREE